jgi:hypothetical protein
MSILTNKTKQQYQRITNKMTIHIESNNLDLINEISLPAYKMYLGICRYITDLRKGKKGPLKYQRSVFTRAKIIQHNVLDLTLELLIEYKAIGNYSSITRARYEARKLLNQLIEASVIAKVNNEFSDEDTYMINPFYKYIGLKIDDAYFNWCELTKSKYDIDLTHGSHMEKDFVTNYSYPVGNPHTYKIVEALAKESDLNSKENSLPISSQKISETVENSLPLISETPISSLDNNPQKESTLNNSVPKEIKGKAALKIESESTKTVIKEEENKPTPFDIYLNLTGGRVVNEIGHRAYEWLAEQYRENKRGVVINNIIPGPVEYLFFPKKQKVEPEEKLHNAIRQDQSSNVDSINFSIVKETPSNLNTQNNINTEEKKQPIVTTTISSVSKPLSMADLLKQVDEISTSKKVYSLNNTL